MHFEVRRIENIAVVELSGELSSRYSPDLRSRLDDLAARLLVPIVLDFSRVVYIDSSGLGSLILLQHQLREKGQTMLVANLTPQVKRVFDKVNMHRVLSVCETLQDALFALKDKRVVALVQRPDQVPFYWALLLANPLRLTLAETPAAELDTLGSEPVDLLLLDVGAERQDIYDMIRRKTENTETAGIPVIVVSAHEDEEFAFAELGVSHFFRDPFEVDEFIETLRRLA